jgi:hypothetical protein
MSLVSKPILCEVRPWGFTGRGDRYLGQLAADLRRVLWKTQKGFTYPTCRLSESAWAGLAEMLVEWAEDIHNDLGLWRTVEARQRQCFGTPLPLMLDAAQKEEIHGFDRRRIQYLLWHVWPCFNPERLLAPRHADLARVAEAASQFLAERFIRVPQDSGVKRFLATPNQYGWDVKRKLVWVGTGSYLFRFLFREYLADREAEPSVTTADDFICQHCTLWAGMGVIDVLAGALDLTEAERDTLRTWYERHTSVYRVLARQEEGGEIKCITGRNVVNGQPYSIRMNVGLAACPHKPGDMVFGSLTPWGGEWYWSGEQRVWSDLPEIEETKIGREMLEQSSAIAYRYCPAEAAEARVRIGEHRARFIAYYGGDLTTFPDGLTLAAAEQRRMIAEWAAGDPEHAARVMRERGLQKPCPRMEFPPAFLNHDQGIGAFFNPEEGVEYLLKFNHVVSALGKRGVELSEEELEALRGCMTSSAISPAFVRRLVVDYGGESIAEAFLIRGFPLDLALDFLLRRHKGHFFRRRYPSLSLLRQSPLQAR